MADWPDWFQESLQQRFYNLTKVAEKQVQAKLLLEKVSTLHMELKNQTDSSVHNILLEWEAAMTLEHSFEKEWLYFEGVRDGMRLIHPIYSIQGFVKRSYDKQRAWNRPMPSVVIASFRLVIIPHIHQSPTHFSV